MKIFLAIFLGFTIGVFAGHTLIFSGPTQIDTKNETSVGILDTVYRVNGFVEAVNRDEQYFLLSVQDKYEKKSRYVLKIYTDETKFLLRSTRYIDNNSRYFDITEDSPEDIVISVGDSLGVSFINTKSDKKFKARTVTKHYYINT